MKLFGLFLLIIIPIIAVYYWLLRLVDKDFEKNGPPPGVGNKAAEKYLKGLE